MRPALRPVNPLAPPLPGLCGSYPPRAGADAGWQGDAGLQEHAGARARTRSRMNPLILPSSLPQTTNTSATGEWVIQLFAPLTRNPPSTGTAFVSIPPGSLPWLGSVRPNAPILSPVAARFGETSAGGEAGTQRACASGSCGAFYCSRTRAPRFRSTGVWPDCAALQYTKQHGLVSRQTRHRRTHIPRSGRNRCRCSSLPYA